MSDQGYDEIMARAKAATDVQLAWIERDEESALAVSERLFEHDPRPELEFADEGIIAVYRQVFESYDEVVSQWWLAEEGGSTEVWRRLMLPDADGSFCLRHLISNAAWLRLTDSERVGDVAALPSVKQLERMSLAAQARVLGRFCLRTDGATAFEYARVARALDPRLLPFLSTWLLDTYMVSPASSLTEGVRENRMRAAEDYCQFHKIHPIVSRATADLSRTIASLPASLDNARPLIEFIVRNEQAPLFGELIEPGRRRPLGKRDFEQAAGGIGVLLNGLAMNTRAAQCIAPHCDALASGAVGYLSGRDPEGALKQLSSAWRSPEADLVQCAGPNNLDGFAEVARAIAARELELLYSPAIDADSLSSWLASVRLARVQATGYGSPRTSAAAQMDYYVGGAALEVDAKQYSERLVLIPGFAMSYNAPPPTTFERERPLDGADVLFLNSAPLAQLHPDLLRAWQGILQDNKQLHLEFHPALSEGRAHLEGQAIAPWLEGCDALLVPQIEASHRRERLEDADIFLDSFPNGGFEHVIDALLAGLPVITMEGKTTQSRLAAALMRKLDLPEFLIAHSWDEYVASAKALATNTEQRLEIRAQLRREDVLSALQEEADPAHFLAALEWMRQEGPRQGKHAAPVYIEAGCTPRKVEDLAELRGLPAHS